MWDSTTVSMIIKGIGETLYMTLLSTLFGYVLGLPLGIALAVTDKTGIKPNKIVYRILDLLSNILHCKRHIRLNSLKQDATRAYRGWHKQNQAYWSGDIIYIRNRRLGTR